MSIADTFKQFLSNIAVDNDDTISLRYGEVTAALNKKIPRHRLKSLELSESWLGLFEQFRAFR